MKPQSIWLCLGFSLCVCISAYAQSENCANGMDDDGDGLIDCFDNDCKSSLLCQNRETDCNDGIDNNGDGRIDCLDSDCKGTTFCPVEVDCNNGVDDDGDGFFDYYDGDCLTDPANPNDYIINVLDCEVEPTGNTFEIEKAWDSPMQTSATRGAFVLADVDKDDTPEVISYNDETGYMYILNGKTGAIENQVKVTDNEQFCSYPSAGDVDGDGYGEIFHIDRKGKVRAYNHNFTPLWSTQQAPASRHRPPLLADFDQDGNSELYYVNEIRNASTGALIVEGSHGKSKYTHGNNWNDELAGVPIAVDILSKSSSCTDCDGLELVLGHVIYSVDLAGKKLTERLVMDNAALKIGYYDAAGYFPKPDGEHNWSSTSVADFNQDGYLDVICSGTSGDKNGPTTIFFWDLQNDVVRSFIPTRPASTIPSGFTGGYGDFLGIKFWKKGVGALNIANIDGDASLECTFMSGSSLYALDDNWNLKWANYDDYWEGSSGYTSTAVFDFDGDGASEIIYRDEINLHIVDGFSGKPLTQYASADFCSSNTHAEYPIVADVDGDGETEIVIVCGRDRNYKNQGTKTGGGNQKYGFVRAYKAANNTYWVPARSIWNQFAYFNVNVNDDLTIPQYQQPHQLRFAQECNLFTTSKPSFSLNKFLNQSPKINFCGNLSFPAPNLEFGNAPVVFPPTCPDTRFQVRLNFTNTGDEIVGKPIPVSFYKNDPQTNYPNTAPNPYLETVNIDVPGGLKPGAAIDTLIWVNGTSGPFTLFVSLNDIGPFNSSGSSLTNAEFYPLDSLNGTVRECNDQPDVISAAVTPFPFNVTAQVIQDNSKCPGSINSDGIVTAHVGGDTTRFVYKWYRGNVVKTLPDYLGATQTGLTGGTYLVVADAPGSGCSSSSKLVEVKDLASPPIVVTSISKKQISCNPTKPTGALTAYVDENGNPSTTGYSFFWYKGKNDVIPARSGYTGGPSVDSLPSGDYRLIVQHNVTGCMTVQDVFLPEELTPPSLRLDNVVNVTVCNPAFADGEAEVSVNGVTAGYDFYWYAGNVSAPDTTTSVLHQTSHLQNVMDGTFTVFAANKVTRCLSAPLTITIQDKSVDPVVNTDVIAPQTACDAALYNGILEATVDERASGGNATETSGYTFEWYQGNVTLATLPATPLATTNTLNNVDKGNYTIVVTNVATGCQTLRYKYLPQQITKPVIDPGATLIHANNCTDPWGSRITVSVDGGKTLADGYTFEWKDGSGSVLPENSEVLENVPPGIYTVLVTSPLGCEAINATQFEILDQAPKPTVTLQRYNNSSCDVANPNGLIAASGYAGAATAYRFDWFYNSPSGTPVAASQHSPNGDTIFNLSPGTYALQITNTTTQCISVAYTTIQNNTTPTPVIDTLSIQATTDCRAVSANGEAVFALVGGALPLPYNAGTNRTYTFRLYAGTTVSGAPVTSNATGQFTGLNFGNYTATVEDNFTHCVSAPYTISIEQNPDIQIVWDHQVPTASCASADGELGVTVSSPSNNSPTGAGYSFNWYFLGASKNGTSVGNPGSIKLETGFISQRDGLSSGYYIIEVSDNFTTCTVYDTLFLPQANPPSLVTSLTHSTQCTPGNGIIDVALSPNGFSLDLYQIALYEGNSIDLGNEYLSWEPVDNSDDTYQFTGLSPQKYTIGILYKASNCPVVDKTVRIKQVNPAPLISFTINPDFTCNTDGTGSLNAQVTGGGDGDADEGHFMFEWFVGSNTSTPLNAANIDSDPSVAINLLEGYYTVRITDNDALGNGCSYIKTQYLPKQYKTIAIADAATLPDSVCGPNSTGNIWVNIVNENGSSVDTTGVYSFSLLDDSGNNPSFTFGGTGKANDPFTNIPEGDYYVKAVNIITGCESSLHAVRVNNTAQNPIVSVTQEYPDFSCDNRPFTGVLNATATGQFDGDPDESHFTFRWFKGANNTNPSDALTGPNLDVSDPSRAINLEAGDYTVRVQDHFGHSNECEAVYTYTVDKVELEIVLTLGSDPQEKCDPADGAVYVSGTQEEYFFNGTQVIPTTPQDYTFSLYDQGLTLVSAPGLGLSSNKFRDLTEGDYFVTTDSAANCPSNPTFVEVDNISQDPIVGIDLLSYQYSLNPDQNSWTGSLEANVHVHPDNPLGTSADDFNYEYRWYHADDYTYGNELGTDATITQLDSGEYLLEVRNTETGCTNIATYFLPLILVEPQLAMHTTPQTVCFADGSLVLDSITFLGESVPTEDYKLWLYANDYSNAPIDSIHQFSGEIPFDSLLAGKYYVRGFHEDLHLWSNLMQLDIRDESTAPLVDVLDLQMQISCDTTKIATGAIALQVAEADGSYDTYQYRWFAGQTTSPQTELVLEKLSAVDSLPSGFYTVLVNNERTQCSTIETFFIPEDITIPVITASANASTVCDPAKANGLVKAEPITTGDYRYDWYVGDSIKSQPDFSGQVWAGLLPGNYTVTATELQTNTCVSDPVTVTVIDASTLPLVKVEMEEYYSSCDPLLANGVLYASVNGQTVGYDYLWYDQNDNIISEGPRAYNLVDQTYRVEVTNQTTGCMTETFGTVERGERRVDAPEIEILSHMTNCVNPDGSASASVNGNTEDYTFLWYYEDGSPLPDSLVSINESDLMVFIAQLPAGNYQVTATEYVTGCVSAPTIFTIEDNSYTPPFRVETTPSTCGLSDGTAAIIPNEALRIASVEWTMPEANLPFEGSYVTKGLPSGTLSVKIIWENGCTSYGTADVGADIQVYNAVTPNGDGKHDFFEIECIDLFPDNTVKIFNRAGALIYEAQYYDNYNVRFEGIGNRGVYVGGKQLPDGTYFYVIEKNDGSAPKTGYLEISK
uniref:Gliding motility-associated C-terminal domain-containing protein n=1 Tax=Roseihalotalea indica TaxID=2867963 RepID=A0AA49GR93_9BACT|nr:gliding motility-associated C-terminal domain-containing protein [Tunicatimonas sp. TK19036]